MDLLGFPPLNITFAWTLQQIFRWLNAGFQKVYFNCVHWNHLGGPGPCLFLLYKVSVLVQEERSMEKYSLSLREIMLAQPKGFFKGSSYISLHILT